MNEYMLVTVGRTKEWNKFSPEEVQSIMQKYYAFVDMLKKDDRFVGGSALREGGFEVKSQHGKISVDGPFAETKEVMTGYLILKADNLDHAMSFAKQCPALTHGESVQVFELSNH